MDLTNTKKWLIAKAKAEYSKDYAFLYVEESELWEFIEEIKRTKTLKMLDYYTKQIFTESCY